MTPRIPGTSAFAPAPAPVREIPGVDTSGVALVFEGGGMRGTYTAALVTVMLQAGLAFPWVGGISAGSSHTCNFVSRDTWRARASFVELAADPQMGGWTSFARGTGYFNSEHIYEHTSGPDEALPFDWDTFHTNPATVRIGSFNCATGEEVYWGQEDFPTMGALLPRVRASSSMPILMPEVMIDGVPYLDGALGPTGGFALDAAQADGYGRFLVVMTRERGYRKPAMRTPGFYRRHFRRHPAVAEALLARPDNYNRTLDDLEQLEAAGRAYLYVPDRMPVANGERRYDRLNTAYELGLVQARRELPAILDFLRP